MPAISAISPIAAATPLPARPQVSVRERPDGSVTVSVSTPAAAGQAAPQPAVSYSFRAPPRAVPGAPSPLGGQLDTHA